MWAKHYEYNIVQASASPPKKRKYNIPLYDGSCCLPGTPHGFPRIGKYCTNHSKKCQVHSNKTPLTYDCNKSTFIISDYFQSEENPYLCWTTAPRAFSPTLQNKHVF